MCRQVCLFICLAETAIIFNLVCWNMKEKHRKLECKNKYKSKSSLNLNVLLCSSSIFDNEKRCIYHHDEAWQQKIRFIKLSFGEL